MHVIAQIKYATMASFLMHCPEVGFLEYSDGLFQTTPSTYRAFHSKVALLCCPGDECHGVKYKCTNSELGMTMHYSHFKGTFNHTECSTAKPPRTQYKCSLKHTTGPHPTCTARVLFTFHHYTTPPLLTLHPLQLGYKVM